MFNWLKQLWEKTLFPPAPEQEAQRILEENSAIVNVLLVKKFLFYGNEITKFICVASEEDCLGYYSYSWYKIEEDKVINKFEISMEEYKQLINRLKQIGLMTNNYVDKDNYNNFFFTDSHECYNVVFAWRQGLRIIDLYSPYLNPYISDNMVEELDNFIYNSLPQNCKDWGEQWSKEFNPLEYEARKIMRENSEILSILLVQKASCIVEEKTKFSCMAYKKGCIGYYKYSWPEMGEEKVINGIEIPTREYEKLIAQLEEFEMTLDDYCEVDDESTHCYSIIFACPKIKNISIYCIDGLDHDILDAQLLKQLNNFIDSFILL